MWEFFGTLQDSQLARTLSPIECNGPSNPLTLCQLGASTLRSERQVGQTPGQLGADQSSQGVARQRSAPSAPETEVRVRV